MKKIKMSTVVCLTMLVCMFVLFSCGGGSGSDNATDSSNTANSDTNTGDTGTGDTNTGDTGTGDTNTGDTGTGDTDAGDTSTGDTDTGDTGTGDTDAGDTSTGDTDAEIPTYGLVAYYPFNGNANDESGNSNDGTVKGATLTSDRFGNQSKAYSFDGVDDYIEIPNMFYETVDSFTFSTWVKINNINDDEIHHILYKSPTMGEAALAYAGNDFLFNVKLDDLEWYGTGYSMQADNEWVHVVGVYYKGGRIELWIDGEKKNQKSIPNYNLALNIYNDYTYESGLGAYTTEFVKGVTEFWKGSIDDVRIYDRALSTSEIEALYKEDTNGDGTTSGNASGGDFTAGNISIESTSIQYRTYSDNDSNRYRLFVWCEKDTGNMIHESEINQIRVLDGSYNSIAIETTTFYNESTEINGYWDNTTQTMVFEYASPYYGLGLTLPAGSYLNEGNYTFEMTIHDGTVLTNTSYFSGEVISPVVDIASMQHEWQSDGSLKLNWTNPTESYDQLRVGLADQNVQEVFYIKPKSDAEEVVIPKLWIDRATLAINPTGPVLWNVSTRLHDEHGKDNARGYSDRASIPWD